jgi:hypothetical protein
MKNDCVAPGIIHPDSSCLLPLPPAALSMAAGLEVGVNQLK